MVWGRVGRVKNMIKRHEFEEKEPRSDNIGLHWRGRWRRRRRRLRCGTRSENYGHHRSIATKRNRPSSYAGSINGFLFSISVVDHLGGCLSRPTDNKQYCVISSWKGSSWMRTSEGKKKHPPFESILLMELAFVSIEKKKKEKRKKRKKKKRWLTNLIALYLINN